MQRLAESAMASVYLAVRLADASGKPLVLKRAPLGERASGRAAQAILREAEVLAEVRGAGIPALEGAGDIAGLPYVALERLRGVTLAKLLATGERLGSPLVRAVGRDVARALAKLHAAGWVHRDVTPSNVLVDDTGEAYLIDFGLCAHAGDERSSVVAGTRGYVAPEAATSASASPAQDVYGLSVCLAEAALGKRLFDEASLVEAAGRGDAPPQVAALSEELPGIGAALRRDVSARPSAADLASGLDHDLDRAALASLVERAQERGSAPPPERATAPVLERARGEEIAAHDRSATPAPAAFGPPPSPPLVTPTISMPLVTVRDVHALATLPDVRTDAARAAAVPGAGARVEPVRAIHLDPPRHVESAPARSRAPVVLVAMIAALVALAIGLLLGRASTRPRGGSFSITGPLPKRAELYLDGKKLTIADGVPMPVSPGGHTITIVTAKLARREIPFQVRGGEQVVILYTARAAGSSGPDDDPPP